MVKITNMYGITFKVLDWKVYTSFPYPKGNFSMSMNRDIISGKSMTYLNRRNRHYMVCRTDTDLWIKYKLEYLSYEELKDIRKSYLHGNCYNSKTKTNGSNSTLPRIPKDRKSRGIK